MRLSQNALENMTDKARNALIGREVRDCSKMQFGVVKIEKVSKSRDSYSVTFTTDKGCGEYTYLNRYAQNLEIQNFN